ncbi:MAG: ABC transporter ATP-binding protein/permease [Chitinophagales bacterium]|nr:ABC transporter ATP-binding protein/permease [Chitinophagales bacterium]
MEGFWRLISQIRYYKKNFTLSILSNILYSLFTVVSIPLLVPFFNILFDQVNPNPELPADGNINSWTKYYIATYINEYGKETTLMYVCIVLIIVFFFKNLFRYGALYSITPMRYGIIYDLRKRLFSKYLDLPLSFYSNEKKGALLSSITVDVQEIEWSILSVIEAIFKAPIIILGCLIYMIYISVSLTIFVFFLVLFAGLIIGKTVSKLKRSSVNIQESIANLSAQVEESLGGLRIIKGFNAETYQKNKFDSENKYFRDTLIRVINRRDLASPLSEFLGVTVVTILLWYGATLVFQQEMEPDIFFAFVFAFYQIIEPAKSFSSAYFNIQKGMAALDRVERVLYEENPIVSKDDAIQKSDFTTAITFENVAFAYKESQSLALDDINLNIKKGEIVALVGSSGAGKSTFVDLLPRFYDVTQGSIKIDGIDIRDIHLTKLRGLFGIVSQEAILFHDTIKNNITFGETHFTDEQIRAAAIIANAHDFISVMPEGYDTSIGDRGMKLSGGQRQRLTIARAILRNPPILILDEATSALDSESEKLVQEALEKVMMNRTSIVVAHRLSTIQKADRIVVLENGKIVQTGTHQALLDLEGPYKRFVEIQALASNS